MTPRTIQSLRGSAALTSLLMLLTTVLGTVALATPAHADPYPAQVRTTCSIEAPNEVVRGNGIEALIDIVSDGDFEVTGKVILAFKTLDGRLITKKTTDYNGQKVKVSTGNFQSMGNYKRTLTFNPSGKAVRSCSTTTDFRVAGALLTATPPGDGNAAPNGGLDQNGILPDTGGPALLWLLLGLALLATGGGVIAYSRRNQGSPYPS
ncbi:hypothetical protein GCM10027020_09850 [Nocardioides salsibiostraticola]